MQSAFNRVKKKSRAEKSQRDSDPKLIDKIVLHLIGLPKQRLHKIVKDLKSGWESCMHLII